MLPGLLLYAVLLGQTPLPPARVPAPSAPIQPLTFPSEEVTDPAAGVLLPPLIEPIQPIDPPLPVPPPPVPPRMPQPITQPAEEWAGPLETLGLMPDRPLLLPRPSTVMAGRLAAEGGVRYEGFFDDDFAAFDSVHGVDADLLLRFGLHDRIEARGFLRGGTADVDFTDRFADFLGYKGPDETQLALGGGLKAKLYESETGGATFSLLGDYAWSRRGREWPDGDDEHDTGVGGRAMALFSLQNNGGVLGIGAGGGWDHRRDGETTLSGERFRYTTGSEGYGLFNVYFGHDLGEVSHLTAEVAVAGGFRSTARTRFQLTYYRQVARSVLLDVSIGAGSFQRDIFPGDLVDGDQVNMGGVMLQAGFSILPR